MLFLFHPSCLQAKKGVWNVKVELQYSPVIDSRQGCRLEKFHPPLHENHRMDLDLFRARPWYRRSPRKQLTWRHRGLRRCRADRASTTVSLWHLSKQTCTSRPALHSRRPSRKSETRSWSTGCKGRCCAYLRRHYSSTMPYPPAAAKTMTSILISSILPTRVSPSEYTRQCRRSGRQMWSKMLLSALKYPYLEFQCYPGRRLRSLPANWLASSRWWPA